jgi:hypothetical protein
MARWRTWLRRITWALLAGLVVTTLTSWLAMFLPQRNAWFGPPTAQDLGLWRADDGKIWQLSHGENAWHTTVSYWFMQASGRGLWIPEADYERRKFDYRQLPRHLRPESLDDLYMNAWFHEVGWPLKALSCSVHWRQQVANADIIYRVEGGVQLPRDADFNPRALPLRPVWPGMAVNVALHASLWMGLTLALAAERRRWRRRHGLCIGCGYSGSGLAADAACPECGTSRR